MSNNFKVDLEKIKKRAREKMKDGATTDAYRADKDAVIDLLNQAVATEIVCILRYKNNYFMANGLNSLPIANEFLEHSREEEDHLNRLSERIVQLGGVPNFDPESIQGRSHTDYINGRNIINMIEENLVAERIAVEIYTEMVHWIGDDDPTTKNLLEDILKDEEEHAEDLVKLLERKF